MTKPVAATAADVSEVSFVASSNFSAALTTSGFKRPEINSDLSRRAMESGQKYSQAAFLFQNLV
jgi:hypothetical protein